jgi:hypothetical protein
MNSKQLFSAAMLFCIVVVLSLGSFVPAALAGNTVSIASDTSVLLSGFSITLILASGSSMVSYSADATTLTLNLDAGSNVTVKSNNLYTLTNSQGKTTQCSPSPAYSYATFSATGPGTVTITPTLTVACSGTAPVIAAFSAAPTSITLGQSSVLSWSLSGADTVSIDNGIGPESNASSSSATVSPSQTSIYTLTATNYIGTTTAQTTVTVTAPSGGGGGGGGSVITPPTIGSFRVLPASILAGQSSIMSWSLTGASKVNITPSVSTNSLSPLSGTATVTPSTTTIYTLVAANVYGQSATASTTVAVVASNADSQPPPASEPAKLLPPSSAPAYCLVNHAGTFVLILNGIRHGIANPGLLSTFGYSFRDAATDTAAYQNLPSGDLLWPNNGALVKASGNPTVYLISGQAKHGFTSASVFRGLGYKFSSVLTIPAPQLDGLTGGSLVSDRSARHLPGANVISHGTVYFMDDTARSPYPSLAVFNTWNLRNDFSRVLPANAADLALPIGPIVPPRPSCSGQ